MVLSHQQLPGVFWAMVYATGGRAAKQLEPRAARDCQGLDDLLGAFLGMGKPPHCFKSLFGVHWAGLEF